MSSHVIPLLDSSSASKDQTTRTPPVPEGNTDSARASAGPPVIGGQTSSLWRRKALHTTRLQTTQGEDPTLEWTSSDEEEQERCD